MVRQGWGMLVDSGEKGDIKIIIGSFLMLSG